MIGDVLIERPVLSGLVGSCVLFFGLMACAMNGQDAPRGEPRWTSSFSPVEAGFSLDLPVRDRKWLRATDLEPGFEGFVCRDAEKRAVYTVVFGTPKSAWTLRDARAFLEGAGESSPTAWIDESEHQGRRGFELVAVTKEHTKRTRVFLDGPRVIVASVMAAAEGADTKRFFASLDFPLKMAVPGSLALGR